MCSLGTKGASVAVPQSIELTSFHLYLVDAMNEKTSTSLMASMATQRLWIVEGENVLLVDRCSRGPGLETCRGKLRK